jgi:CelD/BcsL family acetyltransferase involved in cellulose biosynthesis
MHIYNLDPLLDGRWADLAASHPKASVFHQPGWLKALAKTYGYRPVALTSAEPGAQLKDGFVFCEVTSWITGNRLVSLPFTDHTEPLFDGPDALCEVTEWVRSECHERKWRYVELRPLSGNLWSDDFLAESQSFWLHTLDLTPSLEHLFRKLHKSCLQRRIRHAERQSLSYEKSSSERSLHEFYELLIMTRRRYQVLPQPRSWFTNLIECMAPQAEIRLARKDGKAIAAILTLRHRETVVYKYGCSDDAFHHLAAMPYLFWKLIEESKSEGAEQIDFGRTDIDNCGLIRFKDRFGTIRRPLNYFRYAERQGGRSAGALDLPGTRALCSALPDALSSRAGQLVYRHIG